MCIRDRLSVGLLGNAADIIPNLAKMDIIPDLVTDQTSAHDELVGYIPVNYSIDEADLLRISNKDIYIKKSIASMGTHVQGLLD